MLHRELARGVDWDLNEIIRRGPNLHRVCYDTSFTPYDETPTSLAMYSSVAFTCWLRGLASTDVDIETFIDQELEQNSEIHTGWEKQAMLNLFAWGDRPDLHRWKRSWECSDCCSGCIRLKVQPYWRHVVERIKQGLDPDDTPATPGCDDKYRAGFGSGRTADAACSSSDLRTPPAICRNVVLMTRDDLSSESNGEQCSSGYPAIVPLEWDCIYAWDEIVCMKCWLHYQRTGTRRRNPYANLPSSANWYSSPKDDCLDDEFSPFNIHS